MKNNIYAYTASGAIPAFRVTKMTSDTARALATASTDAIAGVSTEVDTVDTARVDVVEDGPHMVQLGGTVTRGDLLTAGAEGKAVKCLPGGHYFGKAKQSGVLTDVISYNSAFGTLAVLPNYTVTLPTGTGFTAAVASGSSLVVAAGGTTAFTVTPAGGYTITAVTANGVALTADEGVYTIENITSDVVVAVTASGT